MVSFLFRSGNWGFLANCNLSSRHHFFFNGLLVGLLTVTLSSYRCSLAVTVPRGQFRHLLRSRSLAQALLFGILFSLFKWSLTIFFYIFPVRGSILKHLGWFYLECAAFLLQCGQNVIFHSINGLTQSNLDCCSKIISWEIIRFFFFIWFVKNVFPNSCVNYKVIRNLNESLFKTHCYYFECNLYTDKQHLPSQPQFLLLSYPALSNLLHRSVYEDSSKSTVHNLLVLISILSNWLARLEHCPEAESPWRATVLSSALFIPLRSIEL